MNTITLNQNPSPHNLEFTHDLDSHEYLQPKYGYKAFLGFLAFGGFFFLLCLLKMLSDRNDHLPLDYNAVTLWCFSIFSLFGAIYFFPLCQQSRPDKAILWLPTKDKNSQPCLHIRSQNWHYLLAIYTTFFLFLMLLCAAYALGTIPPTQALQPWNWIRITPINLKADLMCAATDGSLIFLILLILSFTQWHIIYDPKTLHIFYASIFLRRPITILHSPWEQLSTVNLIQCKSYNPDKPHILSTITLNNGQEKTFKLPFGIFADPCWMTFIATTLTQLPDTTSRQDFLTNLHQHTPPKAKTRNTKP